MFSQDELISFHEALHQINVPDEVLEKFQKIVSGVYKELTEQKEQNEKLQTVYQKCVIQGSFANVFLTIWFYLQGRERSTISNSQFWKQNWINN